MAVKLLSVTFLLFVIAALIVCPLDEAVAQPVAASSAGVSCGGLAGLSEDSSTAEVSRLRPTGRVAEMAGSLPQFCLAQAIDHPPKLPV